MCFFFYPKDVHFFLKTINFAENLEMTHMAAGGRRGELTCSLRHYDAMRTKIDMRFKP